MSKFFIPANEPEDWRPLLAKPDKQWKTGYSAKALAYAWQEADDFSPEVRKVFQNSDIAIFKDIKMLVAFPEYKVPLPGGRRASQNDIFVLAKGYGQLISIMVEGKVSEPFGETVAEWREQSGKGREKRLAYLCNLLELDIAAISHIRYQFLHRTASALIEAKRFNASNALMLVHSFSKEDVWLDDYKQFLALFGIDGNIDSIVYAKQINGIRLHFGWIRGK